MSLSLRMTPRQRRVDAVVHRLEHHPGRHRASRRSPRSRAGSRLHHAATAVPARRCRGPRVRGAEGVVQRTSSGAGGRRCHRARGCGPSALAAGGRPGALVVADIPTIRSSSRASSKPSSSAIVQLDGTEVGREVAPVRLAELEHEGAELGRLAERLAVELAQVGRVVDGLEELRRPPVGKRGIEDSVVVTLLVSAPASGAPMPDGRPLLPRPVQNSRITMKSARSRSRAARGPKSSSAAWASRSAPARAPSPAECRAARHR